jgi:hypothetical protein
MAALTLVAAALTFFIRDRVIEAAMANPTAPEQEEEPAMRSEAMAE